jgi:hypothetical protein
LFWITTLRKMEIISNLSSNTPASIRAQIDAEYCQHPAMGLRQAELIAYDRAKALSEYRYHAEKQEIEMGRITGLLQAYRSIAENPLARWWYDFRHKTGLQIEIDRFELDLQKLRSDCKYDRPLIRDAVSELGAAMDRREYILRSHPELNVSANVFQEIFSGQIYAAKFPAASINPIDNLATFKKNDHQPRQNYLCPEQFASGCQGGANSHVLTRHPHDA